MGVLKYAILGLLNRQKMTGYDISRACDTSLFEFWNAKHSQIYPELKSLTEAGLVEYEIEIAGNVLQKKLYSISPAGREAFHIWELTRHKPRGVPKDEFRLQLFFSDSIPSEQRLALLNAEREAHIERLAQLHDDLNKFDGIPPADDCAFCDYMVLLGAIKREEASCDWLETCIDLCRDRA